MKRLIINSILFLIIGKIIPGVEVNSIMAALLAAFVYGLLTTFIEPIFQFLALPLNILTFGLMTFVISGFVLYMTSWFVGNFTISGFWTAVFASIVLSLFNSFLYSQE